MHKLVWIWVFFCLGFYLISVYKSILPASFASCLSCHQQHVFWLLWRYIPTLPLLFPTFTFTFHPHYSHLHQDHRTWIDLVSSNSVELWCLTYRSLTLVPVTLFTDFHLSVPEFSVSCASCYVHVVVDIELHERLNGNICRPLALHSWLHRSLSRIQP